MTVNEMLIKLIEQQGAINARLTAIETSLVEHMRRTAVLETKHEINEKAIYRAQGAIALLSLISIVVGIMQYID